MIEVPVELGERRYPVVIGHGLTRVLPELLARFRGRRLVLVASRRVHAIHGRAVERALAALGPLSRVLLPDGERVKNRATLASLWDGFYEARLQRDGMVVALGGGVVGDVTGFAAATYMRGVDWLVLPTTLLSMVDSAIGGKVGINHARAKNLVGAIHQPRAVLADTAFLASLPARELRSGAYEVLKCGVLGDRTLLRSLSAAPPGLRGWGRVELENAVATACRIKAQVVEQDEREGGLRRVLNLGHTIGHALEAVTRYRRFTHGEAVGWGLLGAAWIARRRGLLAASAHEAIAAAVDHLGPRPRVSDLPAKAILEALRHDKKASAGELVFVLPAAIGRVVTRVVEPAEVAQALKALAAREA